MIIKRAAPECGSALFFSEEVFRLKKKRIMYFVTLSTNAPVVLKQALNLAADNEVMIFFDLDGARVLGRQYLQELKKEQPDDLQELLNSALKAGVRLFGCQMNVMNAAGMQTIEGVELAGVATFLDLAYDADSVLSY